MINCLSFFLWTGTILAFLHSLGKHWFLKQFLKRIYKGFPIEEAHNFIIRIDISSCPWALFGSTDLIILTISSVQNSKVDSFCSVANVILGGIERTIVIYRCTSLTKIIVNKLTFTKKSVASWFPTSNGGIKGILVPLTSVFSIFQ